MTVNVAAVAKGLREPLRTPADLDRLGALLLKESPVPWLRACTLVAVQHPPLTRGMLNVAFVSVHNAVGEPLRGQLIGCVAAALAAFTVESDAASVEALQALLRLAEFIDAANHLIPPPASLSPTSTTPDAGAGDGADARSPLDDPPPRRGVGSPASVFDTWLLASLASRARIHARALLHTERLCLRLTRPDAWPHVVPSVMPAAGVERQWLSVCAALTRTNEALALPEAAAGVAALVAAAFPGSDAAALLRSCGPLAPAAVEPPPPEVALGMSAGALPHATSNQSLDLIVPDAPPPAAAAADGDAGGDGGARVLETARRAAARGDWAEAVALTVGALGGLPTADAAAGLARAGPEGGGVRAELAECGATAAWMLENWAAFDALVPAAQTNTAEAATLKAVAAVRAGAYPAATAHIEEARRLIDSDLCALVAESYGRAYDSVVSLQVLSELEEVIAYRTGAPWATARTLDALWAQRIRHVTPAAAPWHRILAVRSLVVLPDGHVGTWLKFARLCARSGNVAAARSTFATLLARAGVDAGSIFCGPPLPPEVARAAPRVLERLAELEFTAAADAAPPDGTDPAARRAAALRVLGSLEAALTPADGAAIAEADRPVVARCARMRGEWFVALRRDTWWTPPHADAVLACLRRAVEVEPERAKAWRALGQVSLRLARRLSLAGAAWEVVVQHVGEAVCAYTRAVERAPPRTAGAMQDTLRVLSLWFEHGSHAPVAAAVSAGLARIPCEAWLPLVPQLMARVNVSAQPVAKQLHALLARIATAHPQSLVYHLVIAAASEDRSRADAAGALLASMSHVARGAQLVEQARLVASELVRVAILWAEQWFEGLEDASRLYFGAHDLDAMLRVLRPLHEMSRHPTTESEHAFVASHLENLQEALLQCEAFAQSQVEQEIQLAWDLYFDSYHKLLRQLQVMTALELSYVSPRLAAASDLILAVPGTYTPGCEEVTIQGFAPVLKVISSKQRPRKLTVFGSDGREYGFLLKGHEDLRQDERVMQLFDLCTTILDSDHSTTALAVVQYPVVPLSQNVGLIGWVDGAETMHALVRDYRDAHRIPFNIEHRCVSQVVADVEHLCIPQRLELFERALGVTDGCDLHGVLLLRSASAELWLQRRTTFTKSLATMSMIGYILGLGDRHPSNLMLAQASGHVVHIDFGDCFEVAVYREKFPETIPFRLTRMLIRAMEVSGIEGTYRVTCESVMRQLRRAADSLLAILEAFVHDPLVNWGLAQPAAAAATAVVADPVTSSSRPPAFTLSPHLPDQPPGAAGASSGGGGAAGMMSRAALRRLPSEGTDGPGQFVVGSTPAALRDRAALARSARDAAAGGGSVATGASARGVGVLRRIRRKLEGTDFPSHAAVLLKGVAEQSDKAGRTAPLDVQAQVSRLVNEATSALNLCQCYMGWCPFW